MRGSTRSFATTGWRLLDLLAGEDIVNGVVLLRDGRLRLCGQGWAVPGGTSDLVVYGLLANGDLETSFGTDGVLRVDFFGGDEFGGACEPGGADTLLVPGMTWVDTRFDAALARVLPSGAFDATFGDGSTGMPGRATFGMAGQNTACDCVLRQADGTLLCATGVGPVGASDSLLVRFLADGRLDATFGAGGRVILDLGGNDAFRTVVALPDGRLAAAGSRTNDAGDLDFSLAVLARDGTLDASAGSNVGRLGVYGFDVTPGHHDEAHVAALDPAGHLLLFGETADGVSNNLAVLRLAF